MTATPQLGSDPALDQLTAIVRDRLGANADLARSEYYIRQVRIFLEEQNIRMPSELVNRLKDKSNAKLHEEFINAITINTTSFFREIAHFEWLEKTGLPNIPESLARNGISVWSAACSTGQELVSALMVIDRYASRSGKSLEFWGMGTDVSSAALAAARSGRYPASDLSKIPEGYRHQYVTIDEKTGRGTIDPRIAGKAIWGLQNLHTAIAPHRSSRHTFIFLRNCLIYFDRPERDQIIARVVERLASGGHLFVGHSETQTVREHGLTQVAPAIFRKAS